MGNPDEILIRCSSSIRNEPEFQKIFRDVEAKYQALHESVGKWLEEQGENL